MASVVASAPSLLAARFLSVRARTLELVAPLTPEDMMVQSLPAASPVKWHLAHSTWFFESFVLSDFLPGYKPFHPDFVWLFNSYYQTFANFPEKRLRSSFSRPGLEEILRYRAHVENGIERLLEHGAADEALARIELGTHHEEQHQELILTDILHAFYTNPLRPVYRAAANAEPSQIAPIEFVKFDGGLCEAGHAGEGFCFDNELPRHRVWLEPFSIASRLVTCGEFAEFIADGGYQRAELWLSDGWNFIHENNLRAPLYWERTDASANTGTAANNHGSWRVYTLNGEMSLAAIANSPVSHISFYEADAYARWAGLRLATEFEWEAAAESLPVGRNLPGNLLDEGLESGNVRPMPAAANGKQVAEQIYGDCWEWTASAYLPYPGFRPLPGSLGEYNGKFMSGQMVLRGGSCCTSRFHVRPSYRNFFAPETRWQFSGIRLATG